MAFVAWVSRRLQEIKCIKKPFGGLNVIIAGDMGQIKPCNERSLMMKNVDNLSTLQKEGRDLINSIPIAINLTKNYRHSDLSGMTSEQQYEQKRWLKLLKNMWNMNVNKDH